jgi:hypothetical protein
MRVGFYVLPRGSSAGSRGKKAGELSFESAKDRDKFVRGLSMLCDVSLAPFFAATGQTLESKEAGILLARIRTALSSGGESTLSSVMSQEVVDLDRGSLEGKLEAFCELLQSAVRDGGLLTTIAED